MASTEPSFTLWEIKKVTWDENRVETVVPGEVYLVFGTKDWAKVVKANGDLQVLELRLKKDEPVKGFDDYAMGQ